MSLPIKDIATKPERERALSLMNRALRSGELVRASTCAWCGDGGRIHGHHPDYNRPLMVVWLCGPCHRQHHATYRHENRIYRSFHESL